MDINAKGKSPKDLYKLLTGSVVPRPIALVSTLSSDGIANVAPYSFFTIVTNVPPTIVFSIGERKNTHQKDTLENIKQTQEFVVNIANVDIAEAVNNAAANFKLDVSEFKEVGLTPIQTKIIDSVAVKEAPIQMECKLDQIIKVGRAFMVLGQVVHFYINDSIYLGDFKTDFEKLNPISRFAGNKYGVIGQYFSIERVIDPDKLIKKRS